MRKIAEADAGGEIEIWGDGLQTRSFLSSMNASKRFSRLRLQISQAPSMSVQKKW